jgi:hypothetical protein
LGFRRIYHLILGLDIVRAYDASVDIGCQTQRLAEEEVSLCSPWGGPRPSGLVVAKNQVIPAQCEGIVMDRLESPQAHLPEGIYNSRTFVQDRRKVLVRVFNGTHRDQKLKRGFPLAHCEPVMLMTPPDFEQSQVRDSSSKIQDITEAARPHLRNEEVWKSTSRIRRNLCCGQRTPRTD